MYKKHISLREKQRSLVGSESFFRAGLTRAERIGERIEPWGRRRTNIFSPTYLFLANVSVRHVHISTHHASTATSRTQRFYARRSRRPYRCSYVRRRRRYFVVCCCCCCRFCYCNDDTIKDHTSTSTWHSQFSSGVLFRRTIQRHEKNWLGCAIGRLHGV